MIKTNEAKLVRMAVQGRIAHPMRFGAYEVDANGRAHSLPSVGGITYNVKVGDSAFGWRGDHIEPGVSVTLDEKDRSGKQATALQFLACVGNEARVITGAAKGRRGVVVGHHGGVEHLIIDFDDGTLDKLTYDDRILIRCVGQGLVMEGYEKVACHNLDPAILKKWGIETKGGGRLRVPVAMCVPAAIMGSGIGHADPGTGDYDITTQDPATVKKLGLDKLRFGDFVAIEDADNIYGRHYYKGAMTIAIVVHSDSFLSGHGPGVTTLLSARDGLIEPVVRSHANIAHMMKIGRSQMRVAHARR
jgi:hypothetical protein